MCGRTGDSNRGGYSQACEAERDYGEKVDLHFLYAFTSMAKLIRLVVSCLTETGEVWNNMLEGDWEPFVRAWHVCTLAVMCGWTERKINVGSAGRCLPRVYLLGHPYGDAYLVALRADRYDLHAQGTGSDSCRKRYFQPGKSKLHVRFHERSIAFYISECAVFTWLTLP